MMQISCFDEFHINVAAKIFSQDFDYMAKFANVGLCGGAAVNSFAFSRLMQVYFTPLYYSLICIISTSITQSNANFAQ